MSEGKEQEEYLRPEEEEEEEEEKNAHHHDDEMDTDEADQPSAQIRADDHSSPQHQSNNHSRGRIVKGGPVDHHDEELQDSRASPGLEARGMVRRGSNYIPSDRLIKPTASQEIDRITWDQQVKDKTIAVSPQPVKKQDPNYVLPEGLTKLTQSRLAERREWEEHLKNKDYEDDIWWEKRKPTPRAQKLDVPSKLKEPTIAVLNCKRAKHPLKSDDRQGVQSPSKEQGHLFPAKIDVTSPLLKTTTATKLGQVDKQGNPKNPPEPPVNKPLEMATKGSGPQVGSKLWRETKSYEHSKWSNKPEEVTAPTPPKAVRPPSARLLEFNAAMNAQKRDKATKPEGDEREKGWDSWHIKEHIPSLENEGDGNVSMSGSTTTPSRSKRGSTSPRLSPRTSPRTSMNSSRSLTSSQAVPENIFSKLTDVVMSEGGEASNQDDDAMDQSEQ